MYRLILTVFYILYNFSFSMAQDQHYKENEKWRTNLDILDRKFPTITSDYRHDIERDLPITQGIIKDDFLVNDDLEGGSEQRIPSIAMNNSGNFVIAWMDSRNGYSDIYYQRYDSSGVLQGINTKVNDDLGTASQGTAVVAIDAKGNFVIAWQDQRKTNLDFDVYYQLYNSNGISQGTNIKVNDDYETATQQYPSIAMNENGSFVIAWTDSRNGNYDIYYQLYDSNGTTRGTNFKINDDVGTEFQGYTSIAIDSFGNFIIAWIDNRNGNFDIYYQRFDSNGIAQEANVKVNDDPDSAYQANPTIAIDGTGNFVIAWGDDRNNTSNIYFQRYDSRGVAQGVNIKAKGAGSPVIAMNGKGHFVITWEDYRNGTYDIYYQRHDSSGNSLGTNVKVTDDMGKAGYQGSPSIAMDNRGKFVITWEDGRNGFRDIYYQRYTLSGITQGINTKANDDIGSADQESPSLAGDKSGNFVVVWEDRRNWTYDIYFQLYDSSGVAQGTNIKANADTVHSAQRPSTAMDGSRNFVIAWTDRRNWNNDIYYQFYASNGTAKGTNVKVNDDDSTVYQLSPSLAMNLNGKFVISWRDSRNGNDDIYCQRYNSDGIAQGINFKVNDDIGTANQWSQSIAMDDNANFVITWGDNRNNEWYSDIYYQGYDSSGIKKGVNVKVNDDIGIASQGSPSIAMDRNGNIVIAWLDGRNYNNDIYCQCYNSNGTKQGTNMKVNDYTETARPSNVSTAIDDSGNFVIVWEERYGFHNPDVIGQRYSSNGTKKGTNYRIVANGPNYGEKDPVVLSNNSNMIVSWMDNRRSKGWDIYAKIVTWDWEGISTNIQSDERLSTIKQFSLLQNYPNPFNSTTTIRYELPYGKQFVTLIIYDLLGRRIRTLINSEEKEKGIYQILWDGKNDNGQVIASGIYFYQLCFDKQMVRQKMAIIK